MLTVVGSSSQALATAAQAAIASGEPIALDPEGVDVGLVSGIIPVELADGNRGEIELIIGPRSDPTAGIVVTTADRVHRRPDSVVDGFGSVPLLYAPATFGGWAAITAARSGADIGSTGVLSGFPAVGDVLSEGIRIRGVKAGLPCGQVSGTDLDTRFARYLPGLVPTSVATAELSSSNIVVHGPLLMPHLTRLADPQAPPGKLYRGVELTVGARFAEAIDSERRALGAAIGLTLPPALDLMLAFYSRQGMRGDSIESALNSFPGFEDTPTPASFDHRYIDDDVALGLACWECMGQIVGVRTPAITAVVTSIELAGQRALRERAPAIAARFVAAARSAAASAPEPV